MAPSTTRAEQIVDTALELAESRGVTGITTAALARRLGFTEAALYRYFPGKVGILVAALQHLSDRLLATMLLEVDPASVTEASAATAQLERHILRFTHREGLLLELLLHAASTRSEPLREAGNAFLQEYLQRIVVYFEHLQERAVIATAITPPELARMWICQLLGGFTRCRLAHEPWHPEDQPGFRVFLLGLASSAFASS